MALYKRLIAGGHWRLYLAVKGVLPKIGFFITKEIEELALLEETTLSSDLSQGYALKSLTGELGLFHLKGAGEDDRKKYIMKEVASEPKVCQERVV